MRTKRPFFHKINDIPLRYKFLLIYLLCVLIPIITINLFFFRQVSANIRIREEDNLRKSIERASAELQGMIDESVALSHSIASDDTIYDALDRRYKGPVDYYDHYYSSLRDKLKRYMSAYPNILEIRIYTNNPTIQTGANYYVIDGRSEDLTWLSRLADSANNIMVLAYRDTGGVTPVNRISVVSKMSTFPSFSSYKKYLRIDLNVSKIYNILNRERDSLQLRLVDDLGGLVAIGGTQGIGSQPSAAAPAETAGGYVMERTVGSFSYMKGWKLIGVADTRRIDGMLNDAGRSILLLAVISTFIPSLLIWIVLRSYHYRVKKLSRHMEKIRSEKFDLIEMPEGGDEIGGLIRTFNVMTAKITSLINDVYKLEIRQKSMELERVRTELNMLQSQMNPHFLFNTLNALLVVCTKNGYADVTRIIKNLSLLMRQLLSRADDLVPLEEELQFTSMYLQIEKFRFGDQFDYTFEVDPEALQIRVPRMSIQPLAENACKHGLQARKGARLIRIAAELTGRGLEIAVIDNGVGIEADKLRQLMTNVRSEQDMEGHVGIRNVYRRLELFYEGNARFGLSSEPGNGTEARIHIPYKMYGAEGRREGEEHVQRAVGR